MTNFSRRAIESLLLVAAVSFAGCSGGDKTALSADAGIGESEAAAWVTALSALQADTGQIYSFVFMGDPAETATNTGVRVQLYPRTAEEACGLYSSAGGYSTTDEFWLLEAQFSQSIAGTYTVDYETTHLRDSNQLTALVTLLHRKSDQFVEKYRAVAGTATLAANADLTTWKAGAGLTGTFDVQFPTNAMQEDHCSGSMALDGTNMTNTCYCVDASGKTSQCTPADGHTSCCEDLTSPRQQVQIQFSASQCAGMCLYRAGTSNFCALLY
jgi:hypothetical protein